MIATEQDVRQTVDMPSGVLGASITRNIQAAEDTRILPAIGRDLYERLELTEGLTDTEEEIKALVVKASCYFTKALCNVYLSLELSNKGVVRNTGDTYATPSIVDIQYLQRTDENIASQYLNQALKMIQDSQVEAETRGPGSYTDSVYIGPRKIAKV